MAPLINNITSFEEEPHNHEFLSIDLSLAKLHLSYEQQSTKCRRRVRFNLSNTRIINPHTEYYTDDDINTKWINTNDLYNIKLDAKRVSNVLKRISKDRGSCIVSVAHRKTTLMMKSDFKALLKLSPSAPDQDLAQWCLQMDGRRGLERFASSDYNAIRSSDVISTRTIVLDEQERQRDFCLRPDPEALAKVARESSRRARTFARFMGVADSLASKDGHEFNNVIKRRVVPSRAQSEMPHPSHCITMSLSQMTAQSSRQVFESSPRKKSKLQIFD